MNFMPEVKVFAPESSDLTQRNQEKDLFMAKRFRLSTSLESMKRLRSSIKANTRGARVFTF